jgi:hypothetical protein
MTITISLTPELERKLRDKAAAAGIATEAFVVGTLAERLSDQGQGQPEGPVSDQESRLLEEINRGLAEEMWQRYHALVAARRAETLTPQQHEELRQLTDAVETAHAARIAALTKLARLRAVSIDALMDQLGIRDPGHD